MAGLMDALCDAVGRKATVDAVADAVAPLVSRVEGDGDLRSALSGGGDAVWLDASAMEAGLVCEAAEAAVAALGHLRQQPVLDDALDALDLVDRAVLDEVGAHLSAACGPAALSSVARACDEALAAVSRMPGGDVALAASAYDLAEELRERNVLAPDVDPRRALAAAGFDACLVLASSPNRDAERSLCESARDWSASGAEGPWERPAGASWSALDHLCESQGTTLPEVLRDPTGPFPASLLAEVRECPPACAPGVCVLASMGYDLLSECVAATLLSDGARAGALPVAWVPAAGSPVVGLFDPSAGAGGPLGVKVACDVPIPRPLLRAVVVEPPGRRDSFAGLMTPDGCYGLADGYAAPAVPAGVRE